MWTLSTWVWILLLSSSEIVNSLAVPSERLALQSSEHRRSLKSHHPFQHDGRPLQIKANPKPAKALPKPLKPSNEADPTRTKPSSPPANGKPSLNPGSSRSSSSLPASSVKPLPFAKEPRPTIPYNVCDLADFDCGDEAEGSAEVLGKRHSDNKIGLVSPHKFEKRSSPRTYSVVPGGGSPTMMMTSLPYPLEAKLFPATGPKVILDYTTDNVRDASFRTFAAAPQRVKPSTYIVEHIVELQSIMLFIKAAIRENGLKGVGSLSEHVDISFFNKHWGTNTPQIQQKITSRPKPFSGSNPQATLSSLNDVIFEAMGSKTNTADFVLCEEGVNSMKAKLWSHVSPFTPSRWKEIAVDAADGSIPSNRHLAGMRSILGVHNYMNNPDVVKRMQDTIKNVKTEFTNFKYVTGEDVKSANGKPVDLAALWIEFMSKQLQEVFKSGTKWVKDQVDVALPLYEKHLAVLKKAMKRITDEEAISDATKRKSSVDKRIEESNDLIKQLSNDEKILNQAEIKFEAAKRASDLANAAMKGATPNTKPALLADRRAKLKAKQAAERVHYKALITKGRRKRDISKLRRAELTSLIQDVEADIKQLKEYRAAAVAMKTPKAE